MADGNYLRALVPVLKLWWMILVVIQDYVCSMRLRLDCRVSQINEIIIVLAALGRRLVKRACIAVM